MRLRNDREQFGIVAKVLHWGVAALIVTQFSIAFYMEDLPKGLERFRYVELHKSIGIVILALMVLRFLWRTNNPPPPLPNDLPVWEIWAANASHWALYGFVIVQSLSGMSLVWAANSPLTFFGWFVLPNPIGPDKALRAFFGEIHEYAAFGIVALLVLHIGAALRHHFILKNNILRRMLMIFLLVAAAGTAAPARAATWNVLPESKILFHFVQSGADFTGQFPRFNARIDLDPAAPEKGRIDVDIDITSIDTQNAERDEALVGKDLFDTEKWTQARFTSDKIRLVAPGNYEAAGTLTIRDVTRPLNLPFTLKIDKIDDGNVKAAAHGEVTISRRDFGLAQGQWAATDIVADEVKIEIKVDALQQR